MTSCKIDTDDVSLLLLLASQPFSQSDSLAGVRTRHVTVCYACPYAYKRRHRLSTFLIRRTFSSLQRSERKVVEQDARSTTADTSTGAGARCHNDRRD